MKKSDTLQVRMSELRTEIRALQDKNELTDKERGKLDKAVNGLMTAETQFRAALAEESAAELEIRNGGKGDPETKERMKLEERARVGNYLAAAARGSSIDGVEKELNEAWGLGTVAGHVTIPTELVCRDMDAPVEERADAVTAPGIENPVRKGRFLDRILGGDSFASRVGVTFDNVPVGVASHVLMTGGTTAQQLSAGEAIDAGAGTFTLKEIRPSRQSARYVWRVEDLAKLEGLEAALRRDIRRVMAIKMDTAIFDGDDNPTAAADDITGLVDAAGVHVATAVARTASGVTFESLLSSFAGLLDGLHAKTPADVATVFGPGLNQELIKGFPVQTEATTAKKVLSDIGFMYGVNDRMSAETPVKASTLIGVGSRAGYRQGAAVAAMWPVMQAITDPYSGAAKGEIALTVHALWNFEIVRPDVFFKMSTAA